MVNFEATIVLLSTSQDQECIEDPRFSTVEARLANVVDFFSIRNGSLGGKTTAQWMESFDQTDVPAFPYNTLEQLLDDPHLQEVEMFSTMNYEGEGTVQHLEPANTFTGGQRRYPMRAPRLGEHSREILQESGLSDEAITRLVEGGVVMDRQGRKPNSNEEI